MCETDHSTEIPTDATARGCFPQFLHILVGVFAPDQSTIINEEYPAYPHISTGTLNPLEDAVSELVIRNSTEKTDYTN